MPHYLIVDCETSHLFQYKDDAGKSIPADAPGQPRLAELGLIFVNHAHEIEAKHSFLIKPEGWEMHPEAEAKTGLTTEFLKANGTPIAEALTIYRAGIAARRVVVGFNVMFDLKMMRAELRRAGFEDNYLQTRNLCLMWATRAMVHATGKNGQLKNPKTEEVCDYFGLPHSTHRALPDCESNYAIMMKLIECRALPEPKSPYDKKAKVPKKAKTDPGLPGDNMDDADQEIPDFLGGAAADGK